jgi:hypothetical protein
MSLAHPALSRHEQRRHPRVTAHRPSGLTETRGTLRPAIGGYEKLMAHVGQPYLAQTLPNKMINL